MLIVCCWLLVYTLCVRVFYVGIAHRTFGAAEIADTGGFNADEGREVGEADYTYVGKQIVPFGSNGVF